MKFSYNWLKELTGFRETPEALAEILNLHSFEVETVEKVGPPAGGDFALDAKIPTNRISDAGNHFGLAKELCAILNLKCKIENEKSKFKIKNKLKRIGVKISIQKSELCPRYTAIPLEIKKIGPSPKWMQERLATCGFRPINGIVDATNYVMLETGQPLHAFDLDKIRGGKMTIRESKQGEELTTLDGAKHKLPNGALIIEDAERLIDLAGIMGGENSAVSEGTKRILLQAATFDPVKIYRTTRALNFSSDAAKIYSAGSDPNKTADGLMRATELLFQMGAAGDAGEVIDIYFRKIFPRKIFFRPEHADRIIGEALGAKFYQNAFLRLGFKIARSAKNKWMVEVPTERKDLQIEEDLNEEIVRLYGYQKLKARLPEGFLVPAQRNDEVWWGRRTADYLAGAGFAESHLYEFSGERELDQFRINKAEVIELENPMNPETKYLCSRILIKYVISTAENLKQLEEIKIFGIAKSFKKATSSSIDEHKDLIAALAQKDARDEEGFYELKGALDRLFEQLGVSDHWYDDQIKDKSKKIKDKSLRIFHPYRVAEIKIGDEKIGTIGEIHPAVLENLKTKTRIAAAEIDFEKLWRAARAEQEFRPIGKYPAIIRDIAVIVPSDTKTDEVQEIIENTGGQLLVDSDLFDYFQDKQMLESEQKSLAFHLVFQSPERTLKDEEVNAIAGKIIKVLEEKGWEVRK